MLEIRDFFLACFPLEILVGSTGHDENSRHQAAQSLFERNFLLIGTHCDTKIRSLPHTQHDQKIIRVPIFIAPFASLRPVFEGFEAMFFE